MLFTIGYATKPFSVFIEQLQQYDINVIADVRSVPFSKVFFDYHQTSLQQTLPKHGIKYVYLGAELGPRSKDPNHYDETGQVQFDRLMESSPFLSGVDRVNTGLAKDLNIALLCAEKDPATCHRSLLISYYLSRHKELEIQHITHDGGCESQDDLESRLIAMQGLVPDLLMSSEDTFQLAYQQQLKQTSYRRS